MAAVWLLPVVTLIVASSTGGLIAEALIVDVNAIKHAYITTGVSFTMLAIGLTLALMMITIYLLRLLSHGIPDPALILSAFVVLGPLGQGGFSLLVNGKNLVTLLPEMGHILYTLCFAGSYILWSMGLCWIVIAILSIGHVAFHQKIGFSMAYWGLIFPNGVFALCSVQLGKTLESPFFHYFGAIWTGKCHLLSLI